MLTGGIHSGNDRPGFPWFQERCRKSGSGATARRADTQQPEVAVVGVRQFKSEFGIGTENDLSEIVAMGCEEVCAPSVCDGVYREENAGKE